MSANTELVTTTAATGTASEWTAGNPILEPGEWGKETDTGKMKNGDGVTAWNSLGYSIILIDTAQLCKAWVNFDGTLSGTITPRSAYNITNITKNGTGDYTINFTTPMPDSNYSVSCNGGTLGSSDYSSIVSTYAISTISVSIGIKNAMDTQKDRDLISVQIYGN